MDLRDESNGFRQVPCTTSRNLSSSSSAFFSANQSPFFSPRSPNALMPKQSAGKNVEESDTEMGNAGFELLVNTRFSSTDVYPCGETSTPDAQLKLDDQPLSINEGCGPSGGSKGTARRVERLVESLDPLSFASRSTIYDVYIGYHGRKPLLLRFTNWLRAELEVHGFSCFAADRARCRNSRKNSIVEKAIDSCTFGVVVLTRKSFRNPYSIEELRYFSSKKNLVPVYFDLGPDDCLARDIIEKRGEIWEKHGGELWLAYGGLEKEWRDAVGILSRVDEWKLEAQDGKWRDCIFRAVTLLALRMGRRSIVDRLNKWRDKAEKNEFPFPRNDYFVGRRKELSRLEFMLFGDVTGEGERDFFELKTRPRRKNVTVTWGRSGSVDEKRKGKEKEPVVWKESEKEIEMQKCRKSGRRRPIKAVYGKGIACVSGESGIGKTELILEFAYRFHQRYKMVLWIGGESRYIRQNYMNLWSILETDAEVKSIGAKARPKSFDEQEEAAIAKIRKELTKNIPFLIVIDSLESENDWWDHKNVMDLLPRFGGELHIIISTRLSHIMSIEPLKLSYLSAAEAMSLMQGGGSSSSSSCSNTTKDRSNSEFDALRVIEEKLGRLTLGLAIVGSILSELPLGPSRLLDAINRASSRVVTWTNRGNHALRKNTFLLQLFEVCFSIFDHANGPRSLATRMVLASGWFGPSRIPVPVLALAAQKVPEKRHNRHLWRKIVNSLACGFTSSYARKSETEASALLLRFNMARASTKEGFIHFNHLTKLYARKKGTSGVAQAMVQALISHGLKSPTHDHAWAACFLLLGFGKDPIVVELKVQELLRLVKEVILPLAIKTFITFSRCNAAMELLRLATEALEATDQELVTPVDKWFDKSWCWGSIPTNAQLNPSLWQELALTRASVLEVRAKLMLRGGMLDVGENLIKKAVFIRTSICGEHHQDTVSARETLNKFTRLLSAGTEDH